jgi:HK97 family phage portal protein
MGYYYSMGLRQALKLVSAHDEIVNAFQVDPDDLYPSASSGWASLAGAVDGSGYVDRATALSVPALKRARDLIASTIASAPLLEYGPDGLERPARALLAQPDPTRTTPNVLASTVADLALEGVSYWYVTERYAEDGRPFRAKHLPFETVGVLTDTMGDVTEVSVNGTRVDPANIIGFEALSGGWLRSGARAIRTAYKLEAAVRVFADKPLPLMALKNMGPKLTEDQVDELLAYWDATDDRSVKYAGRDIELQAVGWSPEQLGLNAAREHQASELARLTGVPAWYLSADSGGSMTYTTTTQTRLDLYALALQPYAVAIEARLSMDDVTGRGTKVRFDFSEFLRSDPELRARLWTSLIASGVMTAEQAQYLEPLVPNPTV